MTRQEVFDDLRVLGYTGALEDMLMVYLSGTGALLDRIYATASTCGGLDNWICRSTSLSAMADVVMGDENVTFGGDTVTW